MYQQNNGKSTFEEFSNMFENILNNIAPTKIEEQSSKSTKEIFIQRNFESYQRKAQAFQYLEGKRRL